MTTAQTRAERLRSRRALMIVREPAVTITIIVIASALAVFVVYPLYMVLRTSLTTDGQLSLAIFRSLLSKSYNRRPLANSLKLGLVVSAAGTAAGFIFAYSTTRVDVPLRVIMNEAGPRCRNP